MDDIQEIVDEEIEARDEVLEEPTGVENDNAQRAEPGNEIDQHAELGNGNALRAQPRNENALRAELGNENALHAELGNQIALGAAIDNAVQDAVEGENVAGANQINNSEIAGSSTTKTYTLQLDSDGTFHPPPNLIGIVPTN